MKTYTISLFSFGHFKFFLIVLLIPNLKLSKSLLSPHFKLCQALSSDPDIWEKSRIYSTIDYENSSLPITACIATVYPPKLSNLNTKEAHNTGYIRCGVVRSRPDCHHSVDRSAGSRSCVTIRCVHCHNN